MKTSLLSASAGLAVVGAIILLGAAPPVLAESSSTSPVAVVEGLVVSAIPIPAGGQGTLVIHPAFGADVTLNLDASTRFRKAGSQLGTPDELGDNRALPAVQSPSPTWFVGLFARASYDKVSFLAHEVALTRPEPLLVEGVVAGASQASLDLNVANRGALHLTLNGDTALRKNGLPVADGTAFQAGDLAQALFWLSPNGNDALRVNGHAPPPQHFEGLLGKLVTDDTGVPIGFDVTRGTTMSFTDDKSTLVKLDGKPGTLADLKVGETVSVFYQKQGDANLAVGVLAYSPRPKPTETHTGDAGKGTGAGDSGKGAPPTGGPAPKNPRPQVTPGVISALCDGSVFKILKGTAEITFSVDAKTKFRSNDKAAACGDVALGQQVYVIFVQQADGTKLAVLVLIHNPPADHTPPSDHTSGEHGSGGGAGTPGGSNNEHGSGGGAGAPPAPTFTGGVK